ncbi:MAG: GAF domain-containing protein, partial [Gaiellaceae bacterium]
MFRTIEFLAIALFGSTSAWQPAVAAAAALVLGFGLGMLLRRRPDRGGGSGPEARDRELGSLRRVAAELARTHDVEGVARTLLDEIAGLYHVGFVALTFVSDDGREASGYLGRAHGADLEWWRDVRVDLEQEPSGIASAVFEATAFTVYDATTSNRISSRLVQAVGARSTAFVPLLVEDRVIAVISVATTDEHRVFSPEDLQLMQTLASEAAVALDRTRTAIELERALERERLLGAIARRLRSEFALDAALQVAVEEIGKALGGNRCVLELGDRDDATGLAVAAEWTEPGVSPAADARLPTLARRALGEGRVVTLEDSDAGAGEPPGEREAVAALGFGGLAATPLPEFD